MVDSLWFFILKQNPNSSIENREKMHEHSEHVAENILNNIVETITDSIQKTKSGKFSEEENTVSAQMNRLFGRQKSMHSLFGGGKCKWICLGRYSVLCWVLSISWLFSFWLTMQLLMCCYGGTKRFLSVFCLLQRQYGCSLNGLIITFWLLFALCWLLVCSSSLFGPMHRGCWTGARLKNLIYPVILFAPKCYGIFSMFHWGKSHCITQVTISSTPRCFTRGGIC